MEINSPQHLLLIERICHFACLKLSNRRLARRNVRTHLFPLRALSCVCILRGCDFTLWNMFTMRYSINFRHRGDTLFRVGGYILFSTISTAPHLLQYPNSASKLAIFRISISSNHIFSNTISAQQYTTCQQSLVLHSRGMN